MFTSMSMNDFEKYETKYKNFSFYLETVCKFKN